MLYLLVFLFFGVVLLWFRIKASYWERRGIPGPKPWPIVGNIGLHITGKKSLGEVFIDINRKYGSNSAVGFFRGSTPCLLILEPELVNRILTKDFKHFQNNEFTVDKKAEPLLGCNPFFLKDNEWKETRQLISPGFTSGKLKNIFPIVNGIGQKFVQFIENHPTATTDGIETRMLTKRFTLDNVAKVAFGIDGKSLDSYDDTSDFMQLANSFLIPESLNVFLIYLTLLFPIIPQWLPIKISPTDVDNKLIGIVSEVLKHRKENNIQSNDFLQFLIELSKENKFSEVEITSHASTFFLDGYITSSLVLSYILICLALHPEYQEKVREEIKHAESLNNGELTYDALQEMKWINACFYESNRIYPIADQMVKVCNASYEYTSTDPEFKNLTTKIKPGDVIMIPYGLFGKQEKYFPEPTKFKPERMLDRDAINKSYFFPFSNGPRVCLGQRMGLMQIKLGLAHVIKNFQVTVSPKLQLPIKFISFNLLNEVKGGIWLRYTKIKN